MAIMKKFAIAALCIVAAATTVYFVYFHHPPADTILDNQRRLQSRMVSSDEEDYDYEDEDVDGEETAKSSKHKWEKWIRENHHVSIGELYSKCEGDEKLMLGKTILLPDKKGGGVMSTTYLNATWDTEINDGEMFIEVKYNGKNLYSNHWDLCTIDEGAEDQIIFCPIKPGKHNFIKSLKIPNYIPKGEYVTKAWMTNQDGEIFGCAFSTFVL